MTMDISGVDLSAGRIGCWRCRPVWTCFPAKVARRLVGGTWLVGSPSTDDSKPVSDSTSSGVDLELARALLELGVLPAMVTPIVDPEVGSSMTPVGYPVPPIPELPLVDSVPLGVAPPARPAGGSPARDVSLLCQVLPHGSVAEAVPSETSPVLWSMEVDNPPSGVAAMDQYLPWSASLPVGRPRIPLCCRLP